MFSSPPRIHPVHPAVKAVQNGEVEIAHKKAKFHKVVMIFLKSACIYQPLLDKSCKILNANYEATESKR